jgi:hypothetical protein
VDFVQLYWKRNRGWPWPDESWGLDPMFGEAGWCRSCGTPLRDQSGPLTLRRAGLSPVGAWVPNWRLDTICLDEAVAGEVRERFRVELREVAWPSSQRGEAFRSSSRRLGTAGSTLGPARRDLHAARSRGGGARGAVSGDGCR